MSEHLDTLNRRMMEIRDADLFCAVSWAIDEIERLRAAINAAQIAFCYEHPDAAMKILVATKVQDKPVP